MTDQGSHRSDKDHDDYLHQIREAIRNVSITTPKDRLEDPLIQEERRTDLALKKLYAKGILGILGVQILIVNVGIFFYGFGVRWNVNPVVIEFWLSATVVQVVAVVLLVTRYLFPSRPTEA